jgi:Domain of unknown function (DUF3846)
MEGAIVKYLVIGPDGNAVRGEGDLSMDALQTLVGGDFEALPTPTGIPVTVLAAGEAKRLGRPANHAATRLMRSRLRPDDFVAGTVVVTGPLTDKGELTDIADDSVRLVGERIA